MINIDDGLSFELYVGDLLERTNPKSCNELERIAEELHNRIEIAIQDYISDCEFLDLDDYTPSY